MTCEWSTRAAGFQALVTWQLPQAVLVARCVAFLPVALTPLWQLEHVPVMPSWVNPVAGFHASVLWHMPHSEAVAMCVADLPGALIPSWQLEQVP